MEANLKKAHDNYLTASSGIKSWLFTLDHKRIGVMYLYTIMATTTLGGILAMLVRTEHLTPDQTIMNADTYNQIFTLHGAIMIFMFIIPGIPSILGNFILPLQLGAKDVAFPRMNLASYWLFVFGAFFAVISIVTGAVDTGWTFYTPYSTTTQSNVLFMMIGVFIMGFSSIFTGINFIVTIHKFRPKGMGWFKMPLFLWGLYATSIIQVLATPVLGITVLLLAAERYLGIGIFDPLLGGDPVLFQHFFWFYSHPAVYIMILPAMGIMSEIFPVFSRKPIFGYRTIAYSSIAIAVIGFLVWGHHMFVAGQSPVLSVIFSALTYSVAIPSAIKVFNWVATMYKGAIQLDTPMLYAIAFILLFMIGGFTGVMLGALATDIPLHDTYFVVAHFHYTMMGGAMIGFLAGLHYWWPKIFGVRYSEFWGRICVIMIFISMNITFFTQFLMGSKGMPRRYAAYPEEFTIYHQISTAGAYMMGIAFIIMATYLIHSLFRGKKAPDNPWGGATMEWQTSSPPPLHNFIEEPDKTGEPYEYTNLVYSEEVDGFVRKS